MIIENIFNLIRKTNTVSEEVLVKIFNDKLIQNNIKEFKLKNEFELFKTSFEIFYNNDNIIGIRPINDNLKSYFGNLIGVIYYNKKYNLYLNTAIIPNNIKIKFLKKLYNEIYINDEYMSVYKIKDNTSFDEWSKNTHIQFINYRPRYNDYIIYIISNFDNRNIYNPTKGYYNTTTFVLRVDKNISTVRGISLDDYTISIDDWEMLNSENSDFLIS